MTFAKIRKKGQRIYKETAEAVAEKEAALQKIVDRKFYHENYIQKCRVETAQEISDLWVSAGIAFQKIVKDAISEKREALKKILSTPPTPEQTALLNSLQLDKGQPSKKEVEAIAPALADNYRAFHALQGILDKAGFTLHLSPTCDYTALTEALDRVEGYLNDRTHELKNFTTWRNAHPWFRLFFGEGWEDNIYTSNTELLDGNPQITPVAELEDTPEQVVEPEPDSEDGAGTQAPKKPTGPKTIGRVVMPPWI